MTFAVLVESHEKQFAAELVGVPGIRFVASTREEAIAGLQAQIAQRVGRGELVSLEVGAISPVDLAGSYANDPTLRGICAEAYRQRDVELKK